MPLKPPIFLLRDNDDFSLAAHRDALRTVAVNALDDLAQPGFRVAQSPAAASGAGGDIRGGGPCSPVRMLGCSHCDHILVRSSTRDKTDPLPPVSARAPTFVPFTPKTGYPGTRRKTPNSWLWRGATLRYPARAARVKAVRLRPPKSGTLPAQGKQLRPSPLHDPLCRSRRHHSGNWPPRIQRAFFSCP
jgi:hypothetical protein